MRLEEIGSNLNCLVGDEILSSTATTSFSFEPGTNLQNTNLLFVPFESCFTEIRHKTLASRKNSKFEFKLIFELHNGMKGIRSKSVPECSGSC